MTNKSTEKTDEKVLQVTLPASTAYIVVDALDLYSRVGLGQLDEIVSMGRFGLLKNAEGKSPTMDELETAEEYIAAAKKAIFGFPSNASHGIYSEKISDRFRNAWGVLKALRHRLAWDRTPEGGIQTSFDEPMRGEDIKGVSVVSATLDDTLAALPDNTMLMKVNGEWAVVRVHPSVTGSPLQMLAGSHSVQTAIQKAQNVLDHEKTKEI